MKRYIVVEIETGTASLRQSIATVAMVIEDFARIMEGDVPHGFDIKIKEVDKPSQRTFKKLTTLT